MNVFFFCFLLFFIYFEFHMLLICHILKVPYYENHILSGLYIYKLVLPEPANTQNEENR